MNFPGVRRPLGFGGIGRENTSEMRLRRGKQKAAS